MENIIQEKPKKFLELVKSKANTFKKKERVVVISDLDRLRMELDDALELLDQARSNFENAIDQYIDIASDELTNANNKVNLIIKKIKIISNN